MEFTYNKVIKVDFHGTEIELKTDKQNNSVSLFVNTERVLNLSSSDFSNSFVRMVNQFDRDVVQKEMSTEKQTKKQDNETIYEDVPHLIVNQFDRTLFNDLHNLIASHTVQSVSVYGSESALRHAVPSFIPFGGTDRSSIMKKIDGIECYTIDSTKECFADNTLLFVSEENKQFVEMFFSGKRNIPWANKNGWGVYVIL